MTVHDDRHWEKVRKFVKNDFKIDKNLSMQFIWDLKLFDFKDGIEDITDNAK
jgi:dynein heavy chain